MKIDELENKLQEMIFSDLEKGRPTDKLHTLDVVQKVKDIIANSPILDLDVKVLVIAAYAHDWGYANLFDSSSPLTMAQLGAQKENHMHIGAEKLNDLLTDPFFDSLTSEQKKRAVHLVSVHDKLSELKDTDELVLMEADSLAGMNTEVMGTFEEPASEERYMQKSKDLRYSKFITEYGKVEYEKLFKKRQQH